MAVEIRELRLEELHEALALAATSGCSCEPGQVDLRLSLVAGEAGRMVGLVLCIGRESSQRRLQLLLGKGREQDAALVRGLMDKALLKLRSRGMSRARIEPAPGLDVPEFWARVNWQSHIDGQEPPGGAAA